MSLLAAGALLFGGDLLAQQLINGTSLTTEQVYQAFTLMRTNRIKYDKYFCGRGLINSKLSFQRPPRKVIAKGLSAGASKEKIADSAEDADTAEVTAVASAQAAGTNEKNLANDYNRVPGAPAMKIPKDAQVYDLSGDVEPITQKEPLVTNPVQKPREAEEKCLLNFPK